jgi:hypothetical protein
MVARGAPELARGGNSRTVDSGARETCWSALGANGRSNAVVATVVASAAQRGDLVVTSDPRDLRELARLVRGVDIESIG